MPSEGFVTGGWLKTIVFGKTFPTQSLHIANCTLLIEKALPSEGFVTGSRLKTIVFRKTSPIQSLHIANCTLLIEKALPSEGFVTGGFHRTHVKTFPISDSFTMNIGFETESYQQFIEEVVENQPNQFKPQDYADAFNRILMDIQCCQCGKITPQWVNLELS